LIRLSLSKENVCPPMGWVSIRCHLQVTAF
jgi:hypothetical protein